MGEKAARRTGEQKKAEAMQIGSVDGGSKCISTPPASAPDPTQPLSFLQQQEKLQ
uniref:Uncharacterized protein n=1 Tax=Arundo donax TaxID=35708 RepID=A0A0A9ARQ6_ARUDO